MCSLVLKSSAACDSPRELFSGMTIFLVIPVPIVRVPSAISTQQFDYDDRRVFDLYEASTRRVLLESSFL